MRWRRFPTGTILSLDLSFFTKEVVLFLEKLLLMRLGFSKNELDLESDQLARMEEITARANAEDLQNLMRLFLIAESEVKLYPLPQIPLILAACKFCLPRKETAEQKISEAQDKSRDQRKESKNDTLPAHGRAGFPLQEKRMTFSLSASSPTTERRGIRRVENKKAKSSPKNEAPEKKDKTAKDKNKTLGQIEAKWIEFLNKIRPINTHVMAILRATSPVKFENGHLTLEVFYRFHKEKLEEPKIREILEKILKETVGEPIRLRFVLAPKETRPPKPVRESDLVDVDVEKLERISTEIQEIFSK
ncbi:hypothetical protein HYS90_02675 [Candidatus Curtissbacteria bacterium]|nr:hypothetical protein [Candidatus Curtissbacteria bacterium]